ncbi:MAG: PEP-CTERM sorting domain-containing protein [Verrucomicrobia bacterium]|nr:PEP-CTERM sorting domain-containing protein [Verrucomicrobiota bacterium]MCH8514261.1 PEP-CTERM sorting domain-containing protein [Kiritimatiellia bacterium]
MNHFTKSKVWLAVFVAGLFQLVVRVQAVTITGYTSEANNRFSSGFPSAPINNTSASFVGSGFDFSSGGWSSTSVSKGFGFLSPQHYLVARHFGGAPTINISAGDGTVISGSERGVTATTYGVVFENQSIGDLSIGTLQTPYTPSYPLYRSGVLDLNNSSTVNTPGNYNGLDVFLYAGVSGTTNSPRAGVATINGVTVSGLNHFFTTNRNDVQLRDGDSGSPAFYGWTNPNGGKDLLTIGNNAAISRDDTTNFLNFTGTFEVMNALNATMTGDGFALRVEGNPSNTWQGGASGPSGSETELGRSQNWSGSTPSDVYVLFDAAATSFRNLEVDSNLNFRGLYFRETGSTTDGFTFGGSNTLTVGRGGITNYDIARQVFTANLALGNHQYWDVGQGGVTIQNLNTNGRLLEVGGAGELLATGTISGSGGLALSGGRMVLQGNNTYTGSTWVHDGQLVVNGSNASSSGIRLGVGTDLAGSGTVAAISGAGTVSPGNSPGILTTSSVDPSGGLGFQFEFTSTGSPDYSTATASINDVLRITGAIPFTQNLDGNNVVSIYLDVASLQLNDTFRGGFYTDENTDFLSAISNGSFQWLLADDDGDITYNSVTYSEYNGPFTFQLSTVSETGNFADGTINGQVMQFVVIPEPGSLILASICLALLGLSWFRRR